MCDHIPLLVSIHVCRTHDRNPLVGAAVLSLLTCLSVLLSLLSGLTSMFAPTIVFSVDDQTCHTYDVPRYNHS